MAADRAPAGRGAAARPGACSRAAVSAPRSPASSKRLRHQQVPPRISSCSPFISDRAQQCSVWSSAVVDHGDRCEDSTSACICRVDTAGQL